jgi:hypothetical protein
MAIALTVIISIVAFVVLLFIFLYTSSRGMRRAAKDFCRLLVAGDHVAAYRYLGTPLTTTVPPTQFKPFLAENGLQGVLAIDNFSDFWIGKGQGAVKPNVALNDGSFFQIQLLMQKQSGLWRVANILVHTSLATAPIPGEA